MHVTAILSHAEKGGFLASEPATATVVGGGTHDIGVHA